jgi:hypothetical protein
MATSIKLPLPPGYALVLDHITGTFGVRRIECGPRPER